MDYNFDDFKKITEKANDCLIRAKEEEKQREYKPLSSFNFFKVISNQYYKENFHSDILKFLLEEYPNFLDNFLELIGADKNNYKNVDKNCFVFREEGRIDVLIKSNTHAIIIENKINWADDQDAQIYRYYKYVKETLNLEVEKIVYLTPLENYPSENSLGYNTDEKKDAKKNEYIKDIESKLVNVIAYYIKDIDNEKKYLLSCLETTLKKEVGEDREEYRFFLKNYIDILKERGVQMMNTSTAATKFLEDIKSSSDDNIMIKIKDTKAIFDSLHNARFDFLKKGYNGSRVSYNSCHKLYKYGDKDSCFLMVSIESAFAEASIFIVYGNYYWNWYNPKSEGREDYKTHQNELIEMLKEKGLINDNDFTQDKDNLALYYNKKFKAIIEDEEALKIALKYDEILSSLNM